MVLVVALVVVLLIMECEWPSWAGRGGEALNHFMRIKDYERGGRGVCQHSLIHRNANKDRASQPGSPSCVTMLISHVR